MTERIASSRILVVLFLIKSLIIISFLIFFLSKSLLYSFLFVFSIDHCDRIDLIISLFKKEHFLLLFKRLFVLIYSFEGWIRLWLLRFLYRLWPLRYLFLFRCWTLGWFFWPRCAVTKETNLLLILLLLRGLKILIFGWKAFLRLFSHLDGSRGFFTVVDRLLVDFLEIGRDVRFRFLIVQSRYLSYLFVHLWLDFILVHGILVDEC